MGQRLGHRDADTPLQRNLAIESVGSGFLKTGPGIGRKMRGIGRVGLDQDQPLCVAHDIGEALVMGADGPKALRQIDVFAPDHVNDGKGQDPLSSFLQRGIKHLVHFIAQDKACHEGDSDPEGDQKPAQCHDQTAAETAPPGHAAPRR